MDIFKFHSPTSPTKLEQGEIINKLKRKLWIERYRQAGEFQLVADASSDIRSLLPIGALISHVDSTEVMIVENHEISETRGKPTEIVISGRGFETIFEQRIVGSNKVFPTSTGVTDYILAADQVWNQAVTLISDHIHASSLIDDDNALPYITILSELSGSGTAISRSLKRGTLYSRLLELLDPDDLGIKVIRPGPWSPLGSASPNIAVVIHAGTDRSDEIIFSYDTGDIESADYLWSNKKLKNAALVTGRWVEVWVDTSDVNYNRRVMQVDASDIDNAFTSAPTGADLANVIAWMETRGRDALSAQNEVALTKAEVSKDGNRSKYRVDFEVGDIVTVVGDYNAASTMRISEYVEIEDEKGSRSYPTLSLL